MNLKKNFVRLIIDNFVDSAYCIGYRITTKDFWNEEISKFRVLKPTFRYWYADPIPCHINNNIYVFMEKYDRFKGIGYIGVSLLLPNGRLSKPRTIIKGDSHLSFPMIINIGDENYYMLPEASETNGITIYKMFGDPYKWKKHCFFQLNEKIVDIACLVKNDKIVLLGGRIDNSNALYTSRQIIILKDLDKVEEVNYEIGYRDAESSLTARNGGAFIKRNGKLFRIGQESTEKNYGIYINLYKILKITKTGIEEEWIKRKSVDNIKIRLSPMFYRKIGIHTYGKCNNGFEVVDVSVTKLSVLPILRKLGILKKQ